MTSLNQGYVRFYNLQETIDPRLSLDNLGGGTITNDLLVFSGNTTNKSLLFFDSEDPNYLLTDSGTTFNFLENLSVYGNGDPIKIKTFIRISNATYNNGDDSLTVTFNKDHGVPRSAFNDGVTITLQDTFFFDPITQTNSITIALNGKTFTASYVSTNSVKLLNLGYSEQSGIGIFDPTNRDPYATSTSFALPGSTPQITYDTLYYVSFSDASNSFKISQNYSKTDKINVITFDTPFDKNIIIERNNTCTKQNIENLSRPTFRDFSFTLGNDVLLRSYNDNFDLLENRLDSANFIRFKKYTKLGSEVFNTENVQFEGTLSTTDLDNYNDNSLTVYDPALRTKSPGIYILDPTSNEENIIALRAYSDNTQPWKLLDNPDPTSDVLEYQVLRDNPADPLGQNSAPRNPTLQEMQCGNLTLSSFDVSNSSSQIRLEINPSNIVSVTPQNLSSNIFSHKLPMIINGEEYSVAVWNGVGTF